jgi:hypothetical protein
MNYKHGDIVRFTYVNTDKPAGGRNIYKEALVLHPNWKGKVHAIDMKNLTSAERMVLQTVLDPDSKGKRFRIPLINDVLRRMDPPTLINNPLSFYNQFVRVFLRGKDAYRTYLPARMSGVQVVDRSESKGYLINPQSGTPLFKKSLFGGGDGGEGEKK